MNIQEEKRPFVVIGGGIGGLAAALGIAQNGYSVTVLERAPKFGEIGAGLQLAPNAMAVLDKLGVLDRIQEYAVFPKRLVLKDIFTGEELTSLDLGEKFRERYGYPYIVMHRSDLHTILLNACQNNNHVTLLNDKEVKTIDHLDNGAKITCSDDSVYRAEAVVGADGLQSTTRRLIKKDNLVGSKYVAYRGAIPIEEAGFEKDMNDVIAWIGPHRHFVQYPIRRKELYNQVAVFRSFRYSEDSDDWGTPDELDEAFGKCCPPIRNAVQYVGRDRHWKMYDREPIDNWTAGRVTLLGDAAHPMLQYLAQGACQALEDAACLTDKLRMHGDAFDQVLVAYQKERMSRTARVQRNARIWGDIWHTDDRIAVLLRNVYFKKRSPDDYEVTDWLYQTRYN